MSSARTRPLRIGIDGRPLVLRRRGVGRYVHELCKELDQLLPGATFFVYSRSDTELPVESERWILRMDPTALGRRLSPLAWLKLRGRRLAREDRLDVFWGTNIFTPDLARGTRLVSHVYDLSFEIVPETYHRLHLWALRWYLNRDLDRADAVIACSKGTSERLRHHTGRAATAIIRPGVAPAFRPASDEELGRCRERYALDRRYLLTVATWEPRKNLARLLRVWHRLVVDGSVAELELVLVGKKGLKYRDEESLLGLDASNSIVDLGFVPDSDLPALYSGARALVFPSLYEGFGMPVLEARACGTPVVTTDIPELREAGGSAAVYVEPTEEGIREGILRVLEASDRPTPVLEPSGWRQQAEQLAEVLSG